MERTYSPRTVALVALASLVLGFVLVFGGGLWLLRPRPRTRTSAPPALVRSAGGFVDDATSAPGDAGNLSGPADDDASASPEVSGDGASTVRPTEAPTAEPTQSAGITIGPASISRCFNAGPPTPIRGAECDRLVELDNYIASRATQIAACTRSGAHGRLGLVMDFRFSTSYANGWGSPTSNIANPGNVAACVKLAILPLPFTNIRHLHDRYLVMVPVDW